MSASAKPKLTLLIESYIPRRNGRHFVRVALHSSALGGDVYQLDLSLDEARKALDDLTKAVEP